MNVVIEIINDPTPATFLLIGLLVAIGAKAIEGFPELRPWGRRVAAAALAAYSVHSIRIAQPTTAEELVGILFRGLMASGLALGLAWIVLAIQGFTHRHTTAPALATFRQIRASARERARRHEEEKCHEAERLAEEQRRLQQAQPVASRAERAKQATDDARRDYNTDCEMIRSLQLRNEERRAALLKARQKLIRRLDEILK
jgi:hypothetical protein